MSPPESLPRRARRALLAYAPLAAATAALAFITTREVLSRGGGPACPLDDAYIHFQYARSIAELHPFRYTPGAAPTPGATSLLWPLTLAPFYAAGLHGARLVWVAWALGWTALALLAVEARRLAAGLVRPQVAIAAGAMVMAFGGNAWFAASGMEVVPFAWLITRAVRCAADWVEGSEPPRHRELLVLALLAPLMRPEGALAALLVAAALAYRPRRGGPWPALAALACPAIPPMVCWLATGQAVTSTAVAKWLPLNPYYSGGRLLPAVLANVGTLFGTLLDGRQWTSVFLPAGGRLLALLALGALPLSGVKTGRLPRSLGVLALALGMLLPTTYETFLVNRVRYVWPFAAAWFVALAALAELLGAECERLMPRLGIRLDHAPLLFAGAAVGLLGSRLEPSIADLAGSADAVSRQHVSIATWAHDELPRDARVGVNDTGAIAYFSDHATFDIVGLTTAGEARYWTAGPGSRFEHYEHLARERLPTHFIVYAEWFGIDTLLGEELASRTVRHTILGGTTMSAYVARYETLGSGEHPRDIVMQGARQIDALDTADLDDERSHGYLALDATQARNVVIAGFECADGARTERRRDHFTLRLAPGGPIVARWGAKVPGRVRVRVDGGVVVTADLDGLAWQEVRIATPGDLVAGVHAIDVEAESGTFDSLHYWAFE
jgi:hypothetical protein